MLDFNPNYIISVIRWIFNAYNTINSTQNLHFIDVFLSDSYTAVKYVNIRIYIYIINIIRINNKRHNDVISNKAVIKLILMSRYLLDGKLSL